MTTKRFTVEYDHGAREQASDRDVDLCCIIFDRFGGGSEVTEDRKKWVVYGRCRIEDSEDVYGALNLFHDIKSAHAAMGGATRVGISVGGMLEPAKESTAPKEAS